MGKKGVVKQQRRKVTVFANGGEQQKVSESKERLRKKLASKQGTKKICLTMIVKNESKNMNRLLDSVKSVIDMICITDTGSGDDTEQVIIEWGKINNIPTTVHHEPFRDFSYNRTHSVRIAKTTYPDADYFLLSDADFVWEINKNGLFDKILLIDQKYLIEQYNKSLSYWNIRLLSAKVDWECIGVTHEYWNESKNQSEYLGEVRVTKITTLVINDMEDGGCKEDKFIRDERLLLEGLADENTSNSLKTRYKFYLAQTLKDMGRHLESVEWYKNRINDKGWVEEVYYSKFQMGYNYEQLGWKKKQTIAYMAKSSSQRTKEEIEFINKWNPDDLGPADVIKESTKYFTDAVANYLTAYKYRPTRAEALYYATRLYRMLGLNQNSYDLAIIGKNIKYPESDTLFIERGCYDYLWDFEISIVGFYIEGSKDEGRKAISTLMERDDLPKWISDTVKSNSRHYI